MTSPGYTTPPTNSSHHQPARAPHHYQARQEREIHCSEAASAPTRCTIHAVVHHAREQPHQPVDASNQSAA
jgi:hypothetical protein